MQIETNSTLKSIKSPWNKGKITGQKPRDILLAGDVKMCAIITQKKTGSPVRFEVTESSRQAIAAWVAKKRLTSGDWLFPSRIDRARPMTTRQYERLVDRWIGLIGLPAAAYGTHSLRRTKASLIYRKTGNMRAVQLLLGHTRASWVRVESGGIPKSHEH